jgi:hypothetical protein
MKKCRILWLFFAIALVLSAVSCTKYSVSEDQLVGRWQLESYQYKEYDKDGRLVLDGTYRSPLVLITILLNSDGTGICEDKSDDSYYVDEGNWYFSDKKITMTMSPVDIETFDVISVTSKELNLHGKEVWDDVTVEMELLFKRI